MRSPDVKVAERAAQFYGAVAAARPEALSRVDTDTRVLAESITGMIQSGTQPARAVETARTNVLDLKPAIRERRRVEYRQLAKQSPQALSALVERDMDPGLFSKTPAASASLTADFTTQAERYYLKTGDVTLARRLAWTDLQRVLWTLEGERGTDGDCVPARALWRISEEVRSDLEAFLKDNPQADGSTARRAGGPGRPHLAVCLGCA